MTNDIDVLRQFDFDMTIRDFLKEQGVAEEEAFLLLAVDAKGQPHLTSAPGREMRRIPNDQTAEAIEVGRLDQVSWFIYRQNPSRGRGRVGGSTYDG